MREEVREDQKAGGGMLAGVLIGMVIGLLLGMAIHREGCLWARRVAEMDEKHRPHRERVREWERRQREGIVWGRID